jgi:hypothetical protein
MPGSLYRRRCYRRAVMTRNDWTIAVGMALPFAAAGFFALAWWLFA